MRPPLLALLAGLLLAPLLPPAAGDEGWTESRGYVLDLPLVPAPCESPLEPGSGGACFRLGEAHRGRTVQVFVQDATERPLESELRLRSGETRVISHFCGTSSEVEVPADATLLEVLVYPAPMFIGGAVDHCWGEVVGPTQGTIVAAFR